MRLTRTFARDLHCGTPMSGLTLDIEEHRIQAVTKCIGLERDLNTSRCTRKVNEGMERGMDNLCEQ